MAPSSTPSASAPRRASRSTATVAKSGLPASVGSMFRDSLYFVLVRAHRCLHFPVHYLAGLGCQPENLFKLFHLQPSLHRHQRHPACPGHRRHRHMRHIVLLQCRQIQHRRRRVHSARHRTHEVQHRDACTHKRQCRPVEACLQ